MIKVQKQKINISEENKKLLKKKIGAVVNFIGVARPKNSSGKIQYIEIEHYPEMTEKKIKEIYSGSRLLKPIQRTLSRLEEMKSREFLSLPHLS